jgi:flagellar motility protein MotE (MotC chaperone)
MSGTDVAQEQPTEETVAEDAPVKKRGNFLAFLRIWLPFPVILGAILFFQFKSGKLETVEEAPPVEAGVFEGAGADLPLLLQALQKERDEIQKEWEDLRFAERRIFVERGEIEARQTEVEELLARVEAKVQVMEEERDRMLGQLAKVYESMKADAAAGILAGLEVETATEIIRRMKERNAAQVMASLEPTAAARISQRMLRQP